jgi:hypothetical protein
MTLWLSLFAATWLVYVVLALTSNRQGWRSTRGRRGRQYRVLRAQRDRTAYPHHAPRTTHPSEPHNPPHAAERSA